MKLHELENITVLPGSELVIPDSVKGLMGITMFWSPNMDHMYSKYNSSNNNSAEVTARVTKRKEKARRGKLWKQAHAFLNNLGQTITKEKLVKVYRSLDKQAEE